MTRRRIPVDDEIDITPMIDCVFLLLIFFMVTSTMNPVQETNIPEAVHGVGITSLDTTVIGISTSGAAGNSSPVIELGENTGKFGSLDDVRAYVEEAVRESRFNVNIKADRDTPSGFVDDVSRVVSSIEGIKLHYGVKDKQQN